MNMNAFNSFFNWLVCLFFPRSIWGDLLTPKVNVEPVLEPVKINKLRCRSEYMNSRSTHRLFRDNYSAKMKYYH